VPAVNVLVDPAAAGVKIHEAGRQHWHTLPDKLADASLAYIETVRQFGFRDFHFGFLLV